MNILVSNVGLLIVFIISICCATWLFLYFQKKRAREESLRRKKYLKSLDEEYKCRKIIEESNKSLLKDIKAAFEKNKIEIERHIRSSDLCFFNYYEDLLCAIFSTMRLHNDFIYDATYLYDQYVDNFNVYVIQINDAEFITYIGLAPYRKYLHSELFACEGLPDDDQVKEYMELSSLLISRLGLR